MIIWLLIIMTVQQIGSFLGTVGGTIVIDDCGLAGLKDVTCKNGRGRERTEMIIMFFYPDLRFASSCSIPFHPLDLLRLVCGLTLTKTRIMHLLFPI